ncbi:MAG: ATP-binding protein [Acidimicrobiales bacterium]
MLHTAPRPGMPVIRLPPHEATTAQLGAAYPFAASLRLPVAQVLVGRDLAGGPFAHDPFELYATGALTNPNVTVLGQIGRGKSALVKSYLFRQAAFGRRIAVLDPKGEYDSFARALGTVPIKLSPRGGTRINPLDSASFGPGPAQSCPVGIDDVRLQRLSLLAALAEATLHRRLMPAERLAIELALDSCTRGAPESADRGSPPRSSPTLAQVVAAVLAPGPAAAQAAGVTSGRLAADGRDVGLELRRLVFGDLAGMFDGTTSMPATACPDALVVDLSDVYHSEALPALMVCAAAWLQSMTSSSTRGGSGQQTVFVVDEAWAVLSDVAVGRYLRSSWKLARARGLANIAVCHRASDLASTGASGSEEVRLAEGLLADSETVVCYAQPASELPSLAALLGCTVEEIEYLPRLSRGVALWRVGDRRFLVEHLLSSRELAIVDTDQALVGAGQWP